MMCLVLLLTFFKIGLFTFGGGYAMLPLITEEVLKNNWLTPEQIVDFVAVSESTPGPFAINIATYVGMETVGFLGAICATVGVVLPSFIVILAIAGFYEKFKTNKYVAGCMTGLKSAVPGLIATAFLTMVKTVFFEVSAFPQKSFFVSLAVFALMLVLALKKKHPVMIVGFSALIGIVCGYTLGL